MPRRNTAPPLPANAGYLPPRLTKVLVVMPDTLKTNDFAEEVYASGLSPQQMHRVSSCELAALKQARWAARGMRSHVVTLLRRAWGKPL